jgi:hypothetical protein
MAPFAGVWLLALDSPVGRRNDPFTSFRQAPSSSNSPAIGGEPPRRRLSPLHPSWIVSRRPSDNHPPDMIVLCGEQGADSAAAPPHSRMLKNPLSPRLLKKVQMQGGTRKAE